MISPNSPSLWKMVVVATAFVSAAVTIEFVSISRAQDRAGAALVPSIAATKTAVFAAGGDVNGNGFVNPGDTIKYTITISNSGTDASNVIFTDTLESNLTLVSGSVRATPLAVNDIYSVSGNVQISVPTVSGLLTNDFDPVTGTNSGFTASGPATTTQNGNLTVNANGSFSYNPAPGFEGADSFVYTVTAPGGGTSTGTVTLNVSGMIWFVNSGAAAGGDGRLSTPFNCLTGAGCYNGSANDPGDNLFIFSGAYTGGITLKNNQRVIGAGAGASISTITGINPPTGSLALPATGGANPTITTTVAATSAFTLASGNTIRGLTIGNTTAADIVGSAFGTLTVAEVTLNGTGRALDLNNGTLAATFQSITSTSSTTQGMALQNCAGSLTSTGGTTISGSTTQGILVSTSTANITFNNTSVTPGSDGVSLQNNSSGTRSFGTLSVTKGSGVGFLHTGGGGLTAISGATTITNPGGRGIDIQNAAASNGVTFAAVNASQSGGTGVNLQNSAGAITFGALNITPDSGQRGLFSSGSTGTITTTNGTINTPNAVAVEINGTSAASRTPLAIVFTSVSTTGGANGIVLTSTSGTFAVNGTGTTAGSGGTLQNITNRGGSFVDANGITLKNMNLSNVGTVNGADPTNASSTCGSLANGLGGNLGCNAGIHMVNVVGFAIDRLVLNGGVQQGINGNNVTGFNMSNSSVLNFGDQTRECGVQFKNLVGSAGQPSTISNSTITGNEMDQLLVQNNSGTLASFTVSGSTLGTSVAPNGVAAIQFIGDNTANMTMSVTSSTLSNNATDGFFSTGSNSAVVNPTVSGCTIQNNINSAVNISVQDSGNSTFNVLNNPTITGSGGNAININLALPSTGILQGTISGNTIGTAGVAGSGAGGTGHGVRIVSNGSGQIRTNITNNTIREVIFGGGINILTRDGSSDINATVTGNTVSPNNVNADTGILATSGATATDSGDMCVDIGGAGALSNNVSNNNTAGLDEVRVRQRFLTTMRLPGYGGGATDTAAIAAFLAGRNNVNGGTTSAGAGTYGGGAPCTPPALAQPSSEEELFVSPNAIGNNSIFLIPSYQPKADLATDIQHVLGKYNERISINSSGLSGDLGTAKAQAQFVIGKTELVDTRGEPFLTSLTEIAGKIGELISPTVYSQGVKPTSAPESGETVTVNGGGPGGFTFPAGKSITITFNATVASVGTISANTFSVSNQGMVSGTNFSNVLTDDPAVVGIADPTVTTIIQPPTISKSFNPTMVSSSTSSTLTFNVMNGNDPPSPATPQSASAIAFTDFFPANLVVATPLTTTNTCGGTLLDSGGGTLNAGDVGIQLTGGGTLAGAGMTCTVSVKVSSSMANTYANTTGAISSLEGGTGLTSNTANLTVLMTTAAGVSVSGRVLSADGRGVRNAAVILSDAQGGIRRSLTSTFGYYRFDDVLVGQTYILSVSSKRYTFTPRVLSVVDELADVDFVAEN
ncbi:MAG: beta strand repeat-containing protein [Pyrinomonadaceae bacterium]